MKQPTQEPKTISQYQIKRYARLGCKQIMGLYSSHFKFSGLNTSDSKFFSLLNGTITGYLAHREDAIKLGVPEAEIRELDTGLACSMIDDSSLKSTPLPNLFYELKGIANFEEFYIGKSAGERK